MCTYVFMYNSCGITLLLLFFFFFLFFLFFFFFFLILLYYHYYYYIRCFVNSLNIRTPWRVQFSTQNLPVTYILLLFIGCQFLLEILSPGLQIMFLGQKQMGKCLPFPFYCHLSCFVCPMCIIQWSLRFKIPLFNNSLHFKTGYQWHHLYTFSINIPLF